MTAFACLDVQQLAASVLVWWLIYFMASAPIEIVYGQVPFNIPCALVANSFMCDSPLWQCLDEETIPSDVNCIGVWGYGGTLPTKLASFTALTSFDFQQRGLTGTIPDRIFALIPENVKKVVLSYNKFTGTLPSTIRQLRPTVTGLTLASNLLTGTVPSQLGLVTTLVQLDLAYNQLTGFITPSLSKMNSLTKLQLQNNRLTGTCLSGSASGSVIPDSAKVVDFSNNLLWGSIPYGFQRSATAIDLSFNQFSGTAPTMSTKLVSFNASDNTKLTVNGPHALDLLFCALAELNLANTEVAGSLPDALFQGSMLALLNLSNTSLTGTLPDLFTSVQGLVHLDLSANQLSSTLPASMGSVRFRELDLSDNGFVGTLPLSSFTDSLRSLKLDRNDLTGVLPRLSTAYGLHTLSAEGNHFTGAMPCCFQQRVYAGEISYINLQNNQLVGGVSDQLGKCHRLQTVQLGNNSLEGTIPLALASLTLVNRLDFSNNSFTGTLPDMLLNKAKFLTSIDVHSNELSGTLPDAWVSSPLRSLASLDVSANSLTGTLPPLCGSMTMLKQLRLYSNTFSGPIPSSILSCVELTHFSAGDNRLTGQLPSAFGSLPLAAMYLFNNALSGTLPPSLGSMRHLTAALNILNNDIAGTLPPSLCKVLDRVVNSSEDGCYLSDNPFTYNCDNIPTDCWDTVEIGCSARCDYSFTVNTTVAALLPVLFLATFTLHCGRRSARKKCREVRGCCLCPCCKNRETTTNNIRLTTMLVANSEADRSLGSLETEDRDENGSGHHIVDGDEHDDSQRYATLDTNVDSDSNENRSDEHGHEDACAWCHRPVPRQGFAEGITVGIPLHAHTNPHEDAHFGGDVSHAHDAHARSDAHLHAHQSRGHANNGEPERVAGPSDLILDLVMVVVVGNLGTAFQAYIRGIGSVEASEPNVISGDGSFTTVEAAYGLAAVLPKFLGALKIFASTFILVFLRWRRICDFVNMWGQRDVVHDAYFVYNLFALAVCGFAMRRGQLEPCYFGSWLFSLACVGLDVGYLVMNVYVCVAYGKRTSRWKLLWHFVTVEFVSTMVLPILFLVFSFAAHSCNAEFCLTSDNLVSWISLAAIFDFCGSHFFRLAWVVALNKSACLRERLGFGPALHIGYQLERMLLLVIIGIGECAVAITSIAYAQTEEYDEKYAESVVGEECGESGMPVIGVVIDMPDMDCWAEACEGHTGPPSIVELDLFYVVGWRPALCMGIWMVFFRLLIFDLNDGPEAKTHAARQSHVKYHIWVLFNTFATATVLMVGYTMELVVAEPPVGLMCPIVLSFALAVFVIATTAQRLLHARGPDHHAAYPAWLHALLQWGVTLLIAIAPLVFRAPTYHLGLDADIFSRAFNGMLFPYLTCMLLMSTIVAAFWQRHPLVMCGCCRSLSR